MMGTDDEGPPEDDVLRILVATDNHLGYMERDPIRGDDTFNTFEEILRYAKDSEVDMVLLGGDLFHENKPSRHTLFRTMELLRKYCMGDAPIRMEILSDERVNFDGTKFRGVNYEDPNYNVGIPVFSVHGNHDDPSGEGSLSALDLLSASNLINYFGKSDNVDDVVIHPILLRKGETRVALYGLGHIRDERLYRTFEQKKVKLLRPIESAMHWFSIFVLHQNRVAHSPKNFVDERVLGDFLDFIIWGHEHDCRIVPEPSAFGNFHICQPGSSVATSLCEGESKAKFIGLLEIHKENFRLQPLPLHTVRPFVMNDVCLAELDLDPEDLDGIKEFLVDKVLSMIDEAHSKRADSTSSTASSTSPSKPMKPLIRLKVEYTGFKSCNPQRFGQQFVGKVANPNDLLLFYRRRRTKRPSAAHSTREREMLAKVCLNPDSEETGISELVSSFLANDDRTLEILPEDGLSEALRTFVDKQENQAIQRFVTTTLEHTREHLREVGAASSTIQPDVISEMVSNLRNDKSGSGDGSNAMDALDIDRVDVVIEDDESVVEPSDHDDVSEIVHTTPSKKGGRSSTPSKKRSTSSTPSKKRSTSSTPSKKRGRSPRALSPLRDDVVGLKQERLSSPNISVDLTLDEDSNDEDGLFEAKKEVITPPSNRRGGGKRKSATNSLTEYFSPVSSTKSAGSRKKRWGKRRKGPVGQGS